MLKIAIVGCGKIADKHLSSIDRIPNSEVVGVCDKELLMAKQLADRFGVDNYYDDIHKLISESLKT